MEENKHYHFFGQCEKCSSCEELIITTKLRNLGVECGRCSGQLIEVDSAIVDAYFKEVDSCSRL